MTKPSRFSTFYSRVSLLKWRPFRPVAVVLGLAATLAGQTAHAETGEEIAARLNGRFKDTAAACNGSTPAYYCSGIIVRATRASADYKFWTHSPAAIELGSLTFSYLRADIGTEYLLNDSGFIFADQATAISQGRAQQMRCIFPFMADTQSGRPNNGCGLFELVEPDADRAADLSSCAGVGVENAADWVKNFTEHGSTQHSQCSLSTAVAAQFKASLEAHGLVASWTEQPNEVLVATWDETKPEALPIEAFFFDVSNPNALSSAQQFQKDFGDATGRWLPILRLGFNAGTGDTFSFNAEDQLDSGHNVAERLNARYADTRAACAGNLPAYNCNGVLIRSSAASPDFHAWDPSPTAVTLQGVSFSYLRADANYDELAWGDTQGYIFKALGEHDGYRMEVRCAFPDDAATDRRTLKCGPHASHTNASRPCKDQGIDTLQEWVTHFHSVSGIFARSQHQCSFAADQSAFAMSIEARSHFQNPGDYVDRHNEVVLQVWPQDIPEQLPLEAFFYVQNSSRAKGLEGARFMQNDYFLETGGFLPVIRVDLTAPTGQKFTYHPNEQGVPGLVSMRRLNDRARALLP